MVRLSAAAAVTALATVAVAQDAPSALPEASAPSGMQCGGCYVVADVAGVVFANVATQTVSVIVVTGSNNGSAPMTVTRTVSIDASTTVVNGQNQATITTSAGQVGAPVVTSFGGGGSTTVLNGATLTSPTQYEVFTAYSVIRSVSSNGACVATTGSQSVLGSAYRYAVPSNAPSDFLLQAESSFINAIGFPTCSAGGPNVASTIQVPVTTTTDAVTTDSLPSAQISGSYTVPNITSAPSIQPAIGGSVPSVNPRAAFGSAAALAFAVGVLAIWL